MADVGSQPIVETHLMATVAFSTPGPVEEPPPGNHGLPESQGASQQ